MSKDQIKWDLQIIFIYYSSYADRNNYKLLKQQNYRRFLIDSQCIQQESSFAHFDIAFKKIHNSAIIFKDFLRLIPDLAQIVYKDKKLNRAESFRLFMKKNIGQLFHQILEKSEFGQQLNALFSLRVDGGLEEKLLQLQAINKMYNQYIKPYAFKEVPLIFQKLAIMLKDFQICPQIISKSFLYLIFLYLIKEEEVSKTKPVFDLEHLARTLICISQIHAHKLQINGSLCPIGKIIKIFQRIQISNGFELLTKKMATQHATATPSLLKPFYRLINKQTLENDNCIKTQEENHSRLFPSSTRHKNCGDSSVNQYFSSKRKQMEKESLRMDNYLTVQSIANESKTFVKEHKQIQKAFQDLCAYGQVANSKTLKSFKIKRLFERMGLLKLVGTAWLDIQIVNLQRSSQSGKIEFLQFLELLSLAAKKTMSTFDEICEEVLRDKILIEQQKLEGLANSNYESHLSEIVYTNEDLQLLKDIVKCSEKPLVKIFTTYAQDLRTEKLMTFNQLWKIMYDFQVFPIIISKNRLYQIFSDLSNVREESEEPEYPLQYLSPKSRTSEEKQINLSEIKKIEYSGFLMSLIYIAQEMVEVDLVPPQKLIMLLQKINESRGYKKISGLSLVQQIRNKYSRYYMSSFKKNQKKSAESFDELLDQL